MPSISIIVPVYKVEKYIKKCIDSILNQSFKDFELILVDDGSPDSCGAICDEYEKKDKRVKVIHKANGGLSSARNAGLDIAKGTYIAFVDSDDYINDNMYEILYKNAIDSDADIVVCDYIKVEEDKEVKKTFIKDNAIDVESFNNRQALNQFYRSEGVKFIVVWNKLYKRQMFDCLRFEEGRIHEDEFIAHKIIYNANKVLYIKEKLYYYIQRTSSIMNESFNIKKLDAMDALSDRINFFKKVNMKELQNNTEYFYVVMLFEYYDKFSNGFENKKAIKIMQYDLRKNIISLFKNNKFNYKEKLLLSAFCINPYLYKLYMQKNKTLSK